MTVISNECVTDEKTEKQKMNSYKIDDVLEHFGTVGKFQILLTILCSFLTMIAAWRIIFDIMTTKAIPWTCIHDSCVGPNKTGDMPCSIKDNLDLEKNYNGTGVENNLWKFADDETTHSIVALFDLRCEDKWMYSFSSSIYFIGAFFGVWMFGRVSDAIGRYLTLLISLGFCVVQAWIIPFFNNISVYLACRFIDGASFGGFFLIAFVLDVEYAPPKYRNMIGTLFHFLTSLGMALISLWGYAFKSFQAFAIAQAIPPTIMWVVCFFFIPESARYYLSKGKDDKALESLKKVADANGKSLPPDCTLHEDIDVKVSFLKIISNKRLLVSAPINMFGWFMTSMVYYMLWFSAKYLAGNIYVNAALLGLAELPGRVAAYLLMDRIGRKKTFMISMILACLCMFISLWDNKVNLKIMYCFGKALAGSLWAVIYLYSSEMYPTKIRNLGSGIGSAAARVAALLAPFVGALYDVNPSLPYLIVGVLALICCGVFWFLPETVDRDLPQTIEEFEGLFQQSSKKYQEDPEHEMHKV